MVDQGVQLKDGVIRIALSQNLVDFQQVEFHGASGTLRATGRVRLDGAQPDLTASIVADKLELFASPDRNLSLSGSASVANGGAPGRHGRSTANSPSITRCSICRSSRRRSSATTW